MADREVAPEELIEVVGGVADGGELSREICPLHTAVGVEHGDCPALGHAVDDIEVPVGQRLVGIAPEGEDPEPARVFPYRYEVEPVGQVRALFHLGGEEVDLVALSRQGFREHGEIALAAARGEELVEEDGDPEGAALTLRSHDRGPSCRGP